MTDKIKVGLLIIATNKYTKFLQPLIQSADQWFFNTVKAQENYEVEYNIFTNQDIVIDSSRTINIFPIEHKQWPWMTLGRYEIFHNHKRYLSKFDYLFYCDADMLFAGEVSSEILSDFTVTIHPGFRGSRGTPETREESLACVKKSEKLVYIAGGFNGGNAKTFLDMSEILCNNINDDYARGIIAVWHDESHLNRYTIDYTPSKYLTPDYCYPESWDLPYEKKLLALDKNHSEMRKE